MPTPDLTRTSAPLTDLDADAVLIAVPPFDDVQAYATWPGLWDALDAIGFRGNAGAVARVALPDLTPGALAVVGTGAQATSASVREAVGAGIRTLTGFESVAVVPPTGDLADAAAEGAALGGYWFVDYKSSTPPRRASRVLIHAADDVAIDLDGARVVGEAVALVKDLVTIPAEWLGPDDLANRAREALEGLDVEVTVLDEEELLAQGFGGILGVGQGSDRPPRAVRLDYAPDAASTHVALVGKGITFDTGGLSLKPAASMVGMKYDMCGAATVLAVLRAIATLRVPIRVTAWLCLADNMPSGHATRPGDVLRMLDGTTVEVLNTDAEGRLVLADGLVAASREHPDLLIDVATLTGAITVALGTRHVGVMGDDEPVQRYLDAAADVGELAWRLPLPAHMAEELDSPIADLQNAKIGDSAGGSLFAGLFLQRFVGRVSDEPEAPRIPWVHLDIAGVGMHKGAGYGFTDKGPTGATVRTLIAVLEEAAR